MTKIRDLLIAWRIRRSLYLDKNNDGTFKTFSNDLPVEESSSVKESSLIHSNEGSPIHNEKKEYVRFPDKSTTSQSNRPGLVTIFLSILLLAVFLILPTVYLFHCFTVVKSEQDLFLDHHGGNKDEVHYGPSAQVHNKLQEEDDNRYHNPTKISHQSSRNLPPPPKPNYKQCKLVKDEDRFDCYPQKGVTLNLCESRGCCWLPSKIKSNYKHKKLAPDSTLGVPFCFYPPDYPSYSYVNITETAYGVTAFLYRNFKSPYADDVETVKMIIKYESESRLNIKLVDPLHNRFEPPYPEVPIVDNAATSLLYKVELPQGKSGFKVIRKSDNTIIFDSSYVGNTIFADQFLQISAKLPSSYIYGLGEHRSQFLLSTNWQSLTMFNADMIPSDNNNLYGSHPFYMAIESSGKSHGVFFLNSNAMDIILQPSPAITFRSIGGIFNLYFFLGPTPSDVISQYLEVIGKPYMPPYWSLGFHLCRFGYKTLNKTREVMQRTIDAGIPLDTQWNDLDYMNNSNIFTYDKQNYRGLPSFVDELHSKGMHYIPLVDPGVSGSEPKGSYLPYDEGIEMNIFIKNSTGQPFIGKVWNRVSTVWPDFTNPRTVDYWILMLKSFQKKLKFDGAWIDMNEPSNFLSGSETGCPDSLFENPPYVPAVVGGVLNHHTLCMTAQHFAGIHYNVHNLYGLSEAIVTSFALAEIRGKRPVVISRSSFPGLGHYAGHWSGDVYSKWIDMKFTIPQLLNFNMFGVPLMGADICGFNGNTTASLCNRWMQLGAFYPFSRNHNTDDGIEQDPVALGTQVVASSIKALKVRYSLLPYLYTLFWAAHIQGDTVARPLLFEFTNDTKTYGIDDQFLWGAAIMITPVLQENVTEIRPYFPSGLWFDYYTKTALKSSGEFFNISAPLDTIPVFLRGGYVIPQQSALSTTTQSRLSKLELLAVPDISSRGTGKLYWDDGDSLNSVEEHNYSLIKFKLEAGKLVSTPIFWSKESPPNLGLLTVLGVDYDVSEVTINQIPQNFSYNTSQKLLMIQNLSISLQNTVVVSWK